jgi:hypothetical protein
MSSDFHSITGPFNMEYPHEVGLAMLLQPGEGAGTAAVVLDAAAGRLLAWDGWYFTEGLPSSEHRTPLIDLFHGEDGRGFPGEAILERTEAWSQALGWDRGPTVQAGTLAARTLGTHWERWPLGSDWNVVAYFLTQMTLSEAERLSAERG